MRLLASRHGALGQTTKQAYVCLRCRVEQTQQKRNASTENDGQRGATPQHFPATSSRQTLKEGVHGVDGASGTQDASFTVNKYPTRSRLKKIYPTNPRPKTTRAGEQARSDNKNVSDRTPDETERAESAGRLHEKREKVDADAFATHVYTRTGQRPEDLSAGKKARYEGEFLKQAPAARVTSLQKFIYGRSGKKIEELTEQERDDFMLQHRTWLAKRKEKARDQNTGEAAGEGGSVWKEEMHKGSLKPLTAKPTWRAFVSEKGEDPQTHGGLREPGASAAVGKSQSKVLFGPNESHMAADRIRDDWKAKAERHAAPVASSTTYQEQFLDAVSQQRAQHDELQSPRQVRPRALADSFFQPSPTPASSFARSTFAWSSQRQVRAYHFSARSSQQASAEQTSSHFQSELEEHIESDVAITEKPGGIRAQLRQWQELHGHEEDIMPDLPQDHALLDDTSPPNSLTRLPNEEDLKNLGQQAEEEAARDAFNSDTGKEGFEGHYEDHTRFLRPGDLVEIEYTGSERESMLGIYIRTTLKGLGQYLLLNGRWVHMRDTAIPYSVTGWIDPKQLEPLHKYLPNPKTASDLDHLRIQAYIDDLDVPRDVTAPLMGRLQAFSDEVNEIYRRNASALDDAHNRLAHETDLRYGSLASAATALLNIPADKLPLTALFTVRKALVNGGFAFNIDRRSHRMTGYMQIRSKEQVRNVEQVRTWIRQWQDDLATKASMDESRRQTHKSPRGAQIMYSFIEKSRMIVAKQRENRQPVTGTAVNLGPSKTRIPITADSDCVKVTTNTEFTSEESEIVRFLEAWCVSNMFVGLPRIESLPPLILNALGLYSNLSLQVSAGFLFLQELGTIMPHENRVRHDQHLLLPSSQHSKPLQNLMTSLLRMRDKHNFQDTMADIRHDWLDLPVYCIDDAGAKEIDDGLSIEDAGVDGQGKPLHWLHVHIANPTAFFSRSHPLAKMARHMGETLYMPERTYMMMPSWATQGHFSLAPDRPCLSFSTKLNSDGEVLEYKVRPGIIRNVMRLTYQQVEGIVATTEREQAEELILTVGGVPPTPPAQKNHFSRLQERHHDELKALLRVGRARQAARKRAGGLQFEQQKPDLAVWQSATRAGLAWDHPHRLGSRTVIGDPVIQFRTQPMSNWFTLEREYAQIMVSEAMLLCSEVAAMYCTDRSIPAIYRGTVPFTDADEHPKADQWRSLLARGKQLPMYLGVPYLQSLGYTVVRTQPLKHAFLGMNQYTKATSPLRRYGDMILHWQIEAALRHEAETGQSMIVNPDDKTRHDRSFLPFSAPVLETIILGLQPREVMIMRAKRYSNDFWASMLLFRMFHFKEGGAGPVPADPSTTPFAGALPPGEGGFPFETLTVFVPNMPDTSLSQRVGVMCLELNVSVEMVRPNSMTLDQSGGRILEEPRQGDLWEVTLSYVDMFHRRIVTMPKRLIAREAM